MDVKKYLGQVRYSDMRIRGKLEELDSLHRLMLALGGSDRTMEKIAALQEEINRDIDNLVDLKREIVRQIRRLSQPEYQAVLEMRYLRGWTWERVAMNMHFSQGYVYDLHKDALKELSAILQRPEEN